MMPLQDLRYSWQTLRRAPGFSSTVVLTLALGVGGSVAMFAFVNGVLLRPLPFPEADRLVQVCETHPERSDWCGAAPGNLWDWQEQSSTLDAVGLGRTWPFSLPTADGRFEAVNAGIATAGLFETFRVVPRLGRLFERGDHSAGGDRVVVLTYPLWSHRFAADEGIVGRSIQVDTESYRVIGVLPKGFEVPYLERAELWLPLWAERVDWRDWRGLRPYGRLARGVTLEEAQGELENLAESLAERYPESNEQWGIHVEPLKSRIVASVRRPLWIFLGAVGLVLAIACINAAILLLARGSTLERELALRQALGAGRSRLLRLLLTQSLLLAILGGGLGVVIGWVTVRLFVGLAPRDFPRLEEVAVDGRVLLFALLLSLFTSLVFGLFPAWRSSRSDPSQMLRGARNVTSSQRARAWMVVAEVALATMLLTGAGLLARSFLNLVDWQPGFETERLITFSLFPPGGKYSERESLTALYRRINEELSSLPGVVSVGEVSAGPLFGGGDGETEFQIEGRAAASRAELPLVQWFDCGQRYFQTMGIPLLRGRWFGAQDTYGAPPVAIVNETMAKRHWPDRDPVGDRVFIVNHETWFEIVGVVADTSPFDPRTAVEPEIYWPLEQFLRGATFYAVRSAAEPGPLIPAISDRLSTVEPDLSVGTPTTLEQRIAGELIEPRFQMTLLALFSFIAFAVAMVGIYGITSYSVVQRTREIGIRLALGAQNSDLLWGVLRAALVTTVAGLALGLAGGLALTRFLQSLLVEVSATDPATLLAVALLLLGVALAAASIPARRAARIQPTECLRDE